MPEEKESEDLKRFRRLLKRVLADGPANERRISRLLGRPISDVQSWKNGGAPDSAILPAAILVLVELREKAERHQK